MITKTIRQKTIKGDIEFIKRLNIIRAEKELRDGIRLSMPDLTREIIKCSSFHELERELLMKKMKLKFDGRVRL